MAPSGSARVSVHGGMDQLTGKDIRLRETVPARGSKRETERAALRVQTKLLNQIDERRSPKTEATVNQLLGRWLEITDVKRKSTICNASDGIPAKQTLGKIERLHSMADPRHWGAYFISSLVGRND